MRVVVVSLLLLWSTLLSLSVEGASASSSQHGEHGERTLGEEDGKEGRVRGGVAGRRSNRHFGEHRHLEFREELEAAARARALQGRRALQGGMRNSKRNMRVMKNRNMASRGMRNMRNMRPVRNVMATPAPTTTPDTFVEIVLRRFQLGGEDMLVDPDSYQYCALRRTEEQVGIDDMDEWKIVQYYALYCIYCATNAQPNALTGLDAEVTPWTDSTNWDANDVDPCDGWYGITCNGNGKVTEIELAENNLSGVWPLEIILLACDGGTFTDAGRLRSLDLFNNGNLFDDFDQRWVPLLGSCVRFLFYGSTGFGAPMPVLPSGVEEYDNSFTFMSGPLDDDNFADALGLEFIVLDGNGYNSTIPNIFSQMPNLEELFISEAFVEGDLSFMQGMQSIQVVWVDRNPGISGNLPGFLGSLNTLTNLNVAQCSLNGPLPASLGNANRLGFLYLYGNSFTGEVPSQYGNLPLRAFRIEGNDLVGSMPNEICSLRDSRPVFSVLGADCNEVSCDSSCCTCCSVRECGLPADP